MSLRLHPSLWKFQSWPPAYSVRFTGNFTSSIDTDYTTDVGYTTCLLMAVIITSIVRDADIWTRNIDSYPSPFPIMPLLFFAFPCLSRASCPDESRKSEGPLCLPGCHCDTKLEHAEMTDGGLVPSTRSVGESLSRTLVRVPDAADRRAPIVIAFEVY